MGQHNKQPLAMHLVLGGGHHQFKKLCIWGLSMILPFLVLFCIFPSGTSLYRPPDNRIVVSQLQVPPLRAQLHHNTLPSDESVHRKAEEEPSSSSPDEPDLESKKAKRHRDGLLSEKSGKQSTGIKAEMTSMDSSSSKNAGKRRNKEFDDPIIETLTDKELDEQANAEDVQPKKRSRKGKIKHNEDKLSHTLIEDEIALFGKEDSKQDDEASAAVKYRSGRGGKKPATEEEDASSLEKEIDATKEDPTSPKFSSSKKKGLIKSEDSIAEAEEAVFFSGMEKTEDSIADAEEAVSFVGKKNKSKTKEAFNKSGKMGYDTDATAEPADEPSAAAKSRNGHKPAREEGDISSSGKGIGATEEDPTSPKSSSAKKKGFIKSKNSIAEEEEAVFFFGKEKTEYSIADAEEAGSTVGKRKLSKAKKGVTKLGKMGDDEQAGTDSASDLLFLENADKEVLRLRSPKRNKKNFRSVQNGGGEDDLDGKDGGVGGGENKSIQAKRLPFFTKQSEKCRYYEGRWIIDSTKPLYNDSTCSLISIDDQKICEIESEKTKPIRWRWQPSHCKMERFKAKTFLKIMQRKSLAFVGDKLAKAQMESLLCLLAQVEKPNLIYEDTTNKSSSWHFGSSNFTISRIWSPYLVQEVYESGYKKLHLDKLDTKWAVMVPTFDVLVLGVGSLFIEPAIYMIYDEVVGCYACKDLNAPNSFTNTKDMSLYSGFRATMRSTLMGVGALPGFGGITLFLQPYGFDGNGSYHFVSMKMKDIQEEELYQAYKRGSIANQSKMEVLHTDFINIKKYDNMQRPTTLTCLVPSPLANTWNELLQYTLTRLLDHKS